MGSILMLINFIYLVVVAVRQRTCISIFIFFIVFVHTSCSDSSLFASHNTPSACLSAASYCSYVMEREISVCPSVTLCHTLTVTLCPSHFSIFGHAQILWLGHVQEVSQSGKTPRHWVLTIFVCVFVTLPIFGKCSLPTHRKTRSILLVIVTTTSKTLAWVPASVGVPALWASEHFSQESDIAVTLSDLWEKKSASAPFGYF